MTSSRLSYNIQAQAVKDTPRLKNHLAKIQPRLVTIIDGLGLAQELAAMLPSAIIIHRNYGVFGKDDDVHTRVSPEQWMASRAAESAGRIWLYVQNEPPFDDAYLNWQIALMKLAIQRGVRLVVGNWAVGNPQPEQWPLAHDFLKLLDQHRDLFILGLHEYGCGVLTSGLYGGYPDNAGVQPGKPGGKNLIPKDNWPQDVSTITQFHCGRFNFLVQYCQKNGINPPRIVLTEHGMDDVSDIKAWANTLEVTRPYLNIRGWKTLQNQWAKWYNPIGWSAERAYFEMLTWADKVIYQGSTVEGQCIFSWGHTSNEWEQFDVAEASEFQALIEAYAAQRTAPVIENPPAPPPAKPPVDAPIEEPTGEPAKVSCYAKIAVLLRQLADEFEALDKAQA